MRQYNQYITAGVRISSWLHIDVWKKEEELK
jgi:hypothetical protein